MSGELKIGDRVTTPDGPGEITGVYQDNRWPFDKRQQVVVQLDEGGGVWRRYYRAVDVETIKEPRGRSGERGEL